MLLGSNDRPLRETIDKINETNSTNAIGHGHVLINLMVNDTDEATFLVDTGSSHSLIKNRKTLGSINATNLNLISVTGQRLDLKERR